MIQQLTKVPMVCSNRLREFWAERSRGWRGLYALWVAIMIATPIGVVAWGRTSFPTLATLGVLAQFTLVLASLREAWGWRQILQSLGLIFGLTWLVEWLGQETGAIFGVYAYSNALQPQLGGVPLLIPLAWGMMLFPALAVGVRLLSAGAAASRWRTVFLGVLGGLAFTAWDLYLDPQMVAFGLWTWDEAGGYFGIPWQNYAGWWVSSGLLLMLIPTQRLPLAPLGFICGTTWLFQALGLGVFWGQPGPAVVGFVVMGGLLWVAERRGAGK